MSTLFTVLPKQRIQELKKEHFAGIPRIPRKETITAHGSDNVDLPVYAANPSAFLPDNLMAVPLNQAKQALSKIVYGYTENNFQQPLSTIADMNFKLPYATQARLLSDFAQRYKNHPAMGQVLRSSVEKGIRANAEPEMAVPNRVMTLVGYLMHYVDPTLETRIAQELTSGQDHHSVDVEGLKDTVEGAKQIHAAQREATQNVASTLNGNPLNTQISAMARLSYDLGGESTGNEAIMHRAGHKENQPNTSAPQPASINRPGRR